MLIDYKAHRLFIEADMAAGRTLVIQDGQANYLLTVLRLREGARLLVFNGHDGEWEATVVTVRKRDCELVLGRCLRPQTGGPDLEYLFAPLKHARLDYMVQKATEMGVARLRPVFTRHTQVDRVNLDRMRANVIEAAEQCGILRIPEVMAPAKLEVVLRGWELGRHADILR